MEMNSTPRNLTGDASFPASSLCNHWKREENYVVSHFQYSNSCLEDSTSSIGSVLTSDLSDDALSSVSSSSLSSTSSSMSRSKPRELPVKRGLSRYYEGKSQTFTSLSDVKFIEDLAKKKNNYRKREHITSLSPKAIVSKKAAGISLPSLVTKAGS